VNRTLRNAARRTQWGVYITDRDMGSLSEHLPLPSREECEVAFAQAQQKLLLKGISAVGEMCLDETGVSALRALAESNRLRIDVQGVLLAGAAPSAENAGPFAVESGDLSILGRGPVFSVRHWKKFLDGSLGSRTAWLSRAYSDSESFGDRLVEGGPLLKSCREALLNGFHLSFHAIGDAALDQALEVGQALFEAMEARRTLESSIVLPPTRHRLEHAQVIRDDQVDKMLSQNFWLLNMQPGHRVSDNHFIRARLGEDRYMRQAYRAAGLSRAGLALALSSDAPIDSFDPEQVLKAAMTHENAHEALSFDEALWLYTTGSRLEAGLDPGKLGIGATVFTTDPESIL
jgi:predicted amidohydrolase YtcJ